MLKQHIQCVSLVIKIKVLVSLVNYNFQVYSYTVERESVKVSPSFVFYCCKAHNSISIVNSVLHQQPVAKGTWNNFLCYTRTVYQYLIASLLMVSLITTKCKRNMEYFLALQESYL
jgi:hypothetical protein